METPRDQQSQSMLVRRSSSRKAKERQSTSMIEGSTRSRSSRKRKSGEMLNSPGLVDEDTPRSQINALLKNMDTVYPEKRQLSRLGKARATPTSITPLSSAKTIMKHHGRGKFRGLSPNDSLTLRKITPRTAIRGLIGTAEEESPIIPEDPSQNRTQLGRDTSFPSIDTEGQVNVSGASFSEFIQDQTVRMSPRKGPREMRQRHKKHKMTQQKEDFAAGVERLSQENSDKSYNQSFDSTTNNTGDFTTVLEKIIEENEDDPRKSVGRNLRVPKKRGKINITKFSQGVRTLSQQDPDSTFEDSESGSVFTNQEEDVVDSIDASKEEVQRNTPGNEMEESDNISIGRNRESRRSHDRLSKRDSAGMRDSAGIRDSVGRRDSLRKQDTLIEPQNESENENDDKQVEEDDDIAEEDDNRFEEDDQEVKEDENENINDEDDNQIERRDLENDSTENRYVDEEDVDDNIENKDDNIENVSEDVENYYENVENEDDDVENEVDNVENEEDEAENEDDNAVIEDDNVEGDDDNAEHDDENVANDADEEMENEPAEEGDEIGEDNDENLEEEADVMERTRHRDPLDFATPGTIRPLRPLARTPSKVRQESATPGKSIVQLSNAQKARQARKPQTSKGKLPPHLPRSLIKDLAKHFSQGMMVSKDAIAAIEDVSAKYWKNLAEDLGAYSEHRTRSRSGSITMKDVILLMKRQGFITENKSLHSLIEEHLSMEYRELLIPCARSGNKVVPKMKIQKYKSHR